MSSRWIFQKRDFTRQQCAANDMTDKNPVRGFYHVYTYDIAEKEAEEDWVWSLQKGERLALVLLDIGKCAHRALSAEELLKAERIFSLFRTHDMQMIVRVVYDREGKGMEREPEALSLVLLHMRQLAPVIVSFSPYILTVQGLFIGSWGEMHSSKFLEKPELCLLYDTLRGATEETVCISVRKPQQQRMLRGADGRIRTGLYDDAILGSETDMGTFGWIDDVSDPDIMWTPKQELSFMQMHTGQAPCGGEVLAGALSCSAQEVLERMQLMHLTYLNSVHEPGVWEQWKRVPSAELRVDGVDAPSSFYDYIRAHLGYRYVLEDVRLIGFRHDEKDAPADRESIRVTVRNTGFACCHDSLRMELLIGGHRLAASFLERQLTSDHTMCVTFAIDEVLRKAGDAQALGVRIALYHEKTGLPIYFANDFSDSRRWEKYCFKSSSAEGVPIGVLSMEKEASS